MTLLYLSILMSALMVSIASAEHHTDLNFDQIVEKQMELTRDMFVVIEEKLSEQEAELQEQISDLEARVADVEAKTEELQQQPTNKDEGSDADTPMTKATIRPMTPTKELELANVDGPESVLNPDGATPTLAPADPPQSTTKETTMAPTSTTAPTTTPTTTAPTTTATTTNAPTKTPTTTVPTTTATTTAPTTAAQPTTTPTTTAPTTTPTTTAPLTTATTTAPPTNAPTTTPTTTAPTTTPTTTAPTTTPTTDALPTTTSKTDASPTTTPTTAAPPKTTSPTTLKVTTPLATELKNEPSCAAIFKKGQTTSGEYLIDPDGDDGPLFPFTVFCDMETDEGATVIGHSNEQENIDVNGFEKPGSFVIEMVYNNDATIQQLGGLADVSAQCKQYVKYSCKLSELMGEDPKRGITYAWWVDRYGQKRINWGGAPTDSKMCACGVSKTCFKNTPTCNCDHRNARNQADDGFFEDKDLLPLMAIHLGDTGGKKERGKITVGKFICTGLSSLIDA